jgi:hypothetical protein
MESKKKEIYRLPFLLIILFVIWAISNISSTVMSVTDGRSVSLGLSQQGPEYLESNAPPEVLEVLPILKDNRIPVFGEWLISSYYGDSLNYMSMAMGYGSYEPYSLRPLYPLLIRAISEGRIFLGENDRFFVYSSTFYLMNMFFFFLSVILGFKIVSKYVDEPIVAISISMISFMQLGYLKTLYSPMVDQPAVFMGMLFVYLFLNKNLVGLILASIVAVLVKDSLIILGVLPGLALVCGRNTKMIWPCITFLSTFLLLRVFSGSDPLSMQYGWEVSKGEFRLDYLKAHLGSVYGIFNWLTGLWFSFGPSLILCVILIFCQRVSSRDRFILVLLMLVSVTFMFAQLMLASRVARTLTPASTILVMMTLSIAYKYYSGSIKSAFSVFLGKQDSVRVES